MIERLSSCDICVDCDPLNPLNDKCTMNKVLEYMALGRPIVQYDLTEGRYSAQQASVYAEPNNINDLAAKIEELLDNDIMRQQMSEIGLKRMTEDLEWKHQKPNLLKVIMSSFIKIGISILRFLVVTPSYNQLQYLKLCLIGS